MSLLPTNIDARITQDHIDATKRVIETALAAKLEKPQAGYPKIVPTNRLNELSTEALAALQKTYECSDWYALHTGLSDNTVVRSIQSKDLAVRKLLAGCLMRPRGQESEHYKNMMHLQRAYPTNGDIYIALAALKMNSLPDDAETLLQLAELCQSFHPDLLPLIRDKAAWMKMLLQGLYTGFSRKLKTAIATPRARVEFSDHYDILVRDIEKLKSTPVAECFTQLQVWSKPTHLPLLHFMPSEDDPVTDCDSILAKMPPKAFSKVMEYLDLLTLSIFDFADADFYHLLAFRHSSASWFRDLTFSVLKLAKLLPRLDWTDIRTFEPFFTAFCTQTAIESVDWPATDRVEIAMRYFAHAFNSITTSAGENQGLLIQYLVERTNLHVSLARLTRIAGDRSLEVAYCLNTILASKARDAHLWAAELESLCYLHVLETMEIGSFEKIAFSSKALIDYGHYIDRPHTVYHIGEKIEEVMKLTSMQECATTFKSTISGIWHLLWYPHKEWPGTHVQPNYATFKVTPSETKVDTGLAQSAEEDENADLEVEATEVPGGAVAVFQGSGKMVNLDNELEDCSISGIIGAPTENMMSAATIELTIQGLNITLNGVSTSIGFSGSFTLNEAEANTRESVGGCFLLWKSALDATDEHWNAELADLSLHHESRTKGAEHLRRERLNDSADELEARALAIGRGAIVGASINYGVPLSETVFTNLLLLADAYSQYPFRTGAPLLTRGFYEGEFAYKLRCDLHELMYTEVYNDMKNTFPLYVAPTTARDLILLISRLESVLTTIAVDLARPESERSAEPLKQRIADYRVVYGYLGISTFASMATDLVRIRTSFETAMSGHVGDELPPTLNGPALELKAILYQFPTCQDSSKRLEYNAAASRLMDWELDTQSDAPLVSFPEGPTTLAQRLAWYEQNERRFSRVHRIQRKWLGYHHALPYELDRTFPPLNLTLLCYALSSGLEARANHVGDGQQLVDEAEFYDVDDVDDFSDEQQEEAVVPQIVFNNNHRTRKNQKQRGSIINATTIALLGFGAVAVGLGAVAVMRILKRKE